MLPHISTTQNFDCFCVLISYYGQLLYYTYEHKLLCIYCNCKLDSRNKFLYINENECNIVKNFNDIIGIVSKDNKYYVLLLDDDGNEMFDVFYENEKLKKICDYDGRPLYFVK